MPIPLVDFTGIGENATDIVLRLKDFPARDGKTDTVDREVRLGGQVATAVVAASAWGLSCRYVGAAGTDHNGELHQKDLRSRGIESHLLRVRGAESRLSYILVEDRSGSRAVLCHRHPQVKLVRRYLKKEWFQRTRLAHVDYPVLSLGILEPLAGSNDPLTALPALRARYGSHTVCATLGEQGALGWNGERFFYAPAFRVPVVDTTGAGDLFHAGFAYGLLRSWDLQHILEFGCAAAGLNCKAHGARGGINPVRVIERFRAGRKCYPHQYSLAALERAAERVHKARA